MLKILAMTIAAALFGTAALAAEATGIVSEVDFAHGTVTLQDGTVFVLPPNYNDPTLNEPDTTATITYEVVDGKNVASSIEVFNSPKKP